MKQQTFSYLEHVVVGESEVEYSGFYPHFLCGDRVRSTPSNIC
jgi:hypothetical protein